VTPARAAPLLLLGTSGALLLGALAFQFIGGLAPCEMCHWQRWAHLAVLAIALPALLTGKRLLTGLAILAMLAAAGLGVWHAGIEQKWWPGVTACAAAATPMAGTSLLDGLAAPLVRCDEIPWSFVGLSMAGWNALISGLAALAAIALLTRTRAV
jgi:disulfide bond formation protein DsbB